MAKRALLVGINAYQAPINPLRGCLHDLQQIGAVLQQYYGFAEGDIKVLADEQATRSAMLDGLDWLVQAARPGDVLTFHYSGHGSQVDDVSGDEWDCRDEILVPYDHDWNNPLRDDDLKVRFDRVPAGANLTIISDSCHSGTVNKDFSPTETPRVLLIPAEIQERIARKVAKRNAEYKAFVAAEYRRLTSELPPQQLDSRMEEFLSQALDRFKQNRFQFAGTAENNVLLAACQDVQTSADAYIDGDWHGAFSYNLAQAIQAANGALTYAQLIAQAGKGMLSYQQVPQLECPAALRDRPVFSPLTA